MRRTALVFCILACTSAWPAPIQLWCPWTAGQKWIVGGRSEGYGYFYDQDSGTTHVISPKTGFDGRYAVDCNRVDGADLGQPVLAAADGTISHIHYDGEGYGWHVMIDHGNGLQTLYAHLASNPADDPRVYEGLPVGHGACVGKCGSTGLSSSSHLHLELRQNGATIPPSPLSGVELYSGVRIVSDNTPGGGGGGPWEGSLNQPAANTETTGWDITVSGCVWHQGGQPSVSRVMIFIQGEYVGDAAYGLFYPPAGTNIGFSYNWNARRWANHTVTVQALAVDSQGGRSDGVTQLASTGVHVKQTTILPPTSLQVSPTDPTSGDDLVATASGGSDVDGEAIAGYQYEWSCDGFTTWYGGATLPRSLTLSGQQWVVRALTIGNHPEPEQRSSPWVTASVTIRDWEGALEQPASNSETVGWDVPIRGWIRYRGPQPPVRRVLVFIQGEYVGDATLSDSGGSVGFSYQWNATNWADRTVTVQALGVDDGGGRADAVESLTGHGVHVQRAIASPPTVTRATYVDATHVDVLFDQALQQASAETVANYSIPYLTVSAAVLLADGKTVRLTTTTQGGSRTYTVFVSHVQGATGAAMTQTGKASWTTSLAVSRATYVDATHADVFFSAALDKATAETVGNYSIPYLTVSAAALQADGKSVRLTTTAQPPNRTFTVFVKGVKDNAGGGLARTNTASWNTPAAALAVVSATYMSATRVDVLFSEAVERASAETVANYSVPYLTVSGAALQADTRTVRLTTSTQPPNRTFTVFVSKVKNAAGIALSRTGTASWKTPGGAGPAGVPVVLSGVCAQTTPQGVAVTYSLSAPAEVEVTVTNLAGRVIARVAGGAQQSGAHTALWSGRSLTGTRAPAGRYLFRLAVTDSTGNLATALVPAAR